jgi:hypothetical protein
MLRKLADESPVGFLAAVLLVSVIGFIVAMSRGSAEIGAVSALVVILAGAVLFTKIFLGTEDIETNVVESSGVVTDNYEEADVLLPGLSVYEQATRQRAVRGWDFEQEIFIDLPSDHQNIASEETAETCAMLVGFGVDALLLEDGSFPPGFWPEGLIHVAESPTRWVSRQHGSRVLGLLARTGPAGWNGRRANSDTRSTHEILPQLLDNKWRAMGTMLATIEAA